MGRDWITSPRTSVEYERGVEEFIQFAQRNEGRSDDKVKFRCPCVNCLNERKLNATKIREHLICDGFLRSYTTWIWHGELIDFPTVSQTKHVFNSTMKDRPKEDKLEDVIHDVGPQEISKKINSQGQFTLEDHHDILATAIGQPKHSGRVRVVGSDNGIQHFRGSSRPTSYLHNAEYEERWKQKLIQELKQDLKQEITKKIKIELYDEMTKRAMLHFKQQFDSYGICRQASPTREHVLSRDISDRCSSSVPAIQKNDKDDTRPCQLYVFDDTKMILVARGTVFEAATVFDGMELLEDEVKVKVEEIVIPDAIVPIPTEEIFTVAQAFQSFLVWPRQLVGSISDPLTHGEGSATPKKIHLSVDDPLSALHQLADIIANDLMTIPCDSIIFGRDAEISLYLYRPDVLKLASGKEELNITLIQIYMMYMFGVSNNKGVNDVYGFIDPELTHEGNKFDNIQAYVTNCFAQEKKIYFVPYFDAQHWQLLVISLLENIVVWFCPLHKFPPKHLKQVVNCSIAAHIMLEKSTVKAKKLRWLTLKCNRETNSYECGYYVMHWMTIIIRAHITSGWETRFNFTILDKHIQHHRKVLAKYVIQLYNNI